jgi:hypothetical protein
VRSAVRRRGERSTAETRVHGRSPGTTVVGRAVRTPALVTGVEHASEPFDDIRCELSAPDLRDEHDTRTDRTWILT